MCFGELPFNSATYINNIHIYMIQAVKNGVLPGLEPSANALTTELSRHTDQPTIFTI